MDKNIFHERYSRQMMLPEVGEAGQQKLSEASVLVVGLGGLGSVVATYLAGAGVGRLGLADIDSVSESNLQRQVLYTEASVGNPKVDEAAKRLSAQSSHTVLNLHRDGLNESNAVDLISGYDLVMDCTDNYPSRYLIDKTCRKLNRPWIYGALEEYRGQVSVINYQAGVQYTSLYADQESLCAKPHTVKGVIGAVAGVVGAIQSMEAIKLICGFGELLDGKLLIINLYEPDFKILEL